MDASQDNPQKWDQAVRDRLAKLRTMPVETARLERMLRDRIGPPSDVSATTARWRIEWRRPLRAVAAVAAVLVIAVVVLITTSGGPVMASPTEMARMHEDLVSGRVAVTQVDSIDAANRQLAAQWPSSPGMPVPQEHVMACCMKSVKDKRVACVLLRGREDAPITMTVANAADMKLPTSPAVMHNGVAYHVQSSGQLNMVSTERDGRWVCLIASLPAERLMDVATRLTF